jgi:hypothetical protein
MTKIAAGTPLWKISTPAIMHEKASTVDTAVDMTFGNKNTLLNFAKLSKEQDPIKRAALIVEALVAVDRIWATNGPFNSVLGEYDYRTTKINGQEYEMIAQQTSHHPPVCHHKLTGPGFVLRTKEGIGAPSLSLGFTSVVISFDSTFELEVEDVGVIQISTIPFMVDNLMSSTYKKGFQYGDFWIKDPSGITFKAKLGKNHKLSGDFVQLDKIIESVDGDLKSGVFLKSIRAIFAKGLVNDPTDMIVPEHVLTDRWYTKNVWKSVYSAMSNSKPDYDAADREKSLIEQEQREIARNRTVPFKSQFGFECRAQSKISIFGA